MSIFFCMLLLLQKHSKIEDQEIVIEKTIKKIAGLIMKKMFNTLLRLIAFNSGVAASAVALILPRALRMKDDLTSFQQHRVDMLPDMLAVLVIVFWVSYWLRELWNLHAYPLDNDD